MCVRRWDVSDVLHVNLNERGIWPGVQHGDSTAVGGSDARGSACQHFFCPCHYIVSSSSVHGIVLSAVFLSMPLHCQYLFFSPCSTCQRFSCPCGACQHYFSLHAVCGMLDLFRPCTSGRHFKISRGIVSKFFFVH